MGIEPLPCPFCGRKAKKKLRRGGDHNGYADTVFYECDVCFVRRGATGDSSKPGYADNSTIEHRALEKWNQRA